MDRRTLIVSVVTAVVAAQILFDGVDPALANENMPDPFLEAKASVCVDLARQALGRSKDQVIEDHAFDLMHLPNHVVVRMANRTGCVNHLKDFKAAIKSYKARPTV